MTKVKVQAGVKENKNNKSPRMGENQIERITEMIGDKVDLQLESNNSFRDLSYKMECRDGFVVA